MPPRRRPSSRKSRASAKTPETQVSSRAERAERAAKRDSSRVTTPTPGKRQKKSRPVFEMPPPKFEIQGHPIYIWNIPFLDQIIMTVFLGTVKRQWDKLSAFEEEFKLQEKLAFYMNENQTLSNPWYVFAVMLESLYSKHRDLRELVLNRFRTRYEDIIASYKQNPLSVSVTEFAFYAKYLLDGELAVERKHPLSRDSILNLNSKYEKLWAEPMQILEHLFTLRKNKLVNDLGQQPNLTVWQPFKTLIVQPVGTVTVTILFEDYDDIVITTDREFTIEADEWHGKLYLNGKLLAYKYGRFGNFLTGDNRLYYVFVQGQANVIDKNVHKNPVDEDELLRVLNHNAYDN